jgi:hypothetical protein
MDIAMKPQSCLLMLGVLASSGCEAPKVPMSQLQTREIQTRSYDISDPKRALKAVLNVLQDEGFIIKQTNLDLGFLYAAKEADVEDKAERRWATFWQRRGEATWKKDSITECTANVTPFGDGIRVRLNFQAKVMDNTGRVMAVGAIDTPAFYQRFFSRIEKGIFIEKEGL